MKADRAIGRLSERKYARGIGRGLAASLIMGVTCVAVSARASAATPGNGQIGVIAGDIGNGLGTGIAQQPYGLAVGNDGSVYVSDVSRPYGDSVVRRLDPSTGQEQVAAGDGDLNSHLNTSVDALHGPVFHPGGMAIDPTNGTLVFDQSGTGQTVRYTPPSGPGAGTLSDIPSQQGSANDGNDVTVDSRGNVIAPRFGGTSVSVWAAQSGTFWGVPMTAGNTYVVQEGHATPWAVTVDHDNNLVVSNIYGIEVVADQTGTYYGQLMTAGGVYPLTLPFGSGYSGDGGPASNASVNSPHGVYVDTTGNIILADTYSNTVRVIAAATGKFYGVSMTAGDIYTVAGTCSTQFNCQGQFGGDTGPALAAFLNNPTAARVDKSGNLVVADEGNDRVRVVATTDGTFYGRSMTAGDIYTVAGNGWNAFSGDGGPQGSAQLNGAAGISLDSFGNELIADTFNNRVRVVARSPGKYYGIQMTAGDIYTVVGTGVPNYLGDTGPATSADLNQPNSVRTDPNGNLLIADSGNYSVRVVAESTNTYYGIPMTAGDIYNVAGTLGAPGSGGDGFAATSAHLNYPQDAITDSSGNVVIADTRNNTVRVVAESTGTFFGKSMTAGDIYTVAGTGTAGYNGDSTPATSAELNAPTGLALDPSGNVVIADSQNHLVRVLADLGGPDFGTSMVAGGIVTIMGGGSSSGPQPLQLLLSPHSLAFDANGDLLVAGSERVFVLSNVSGTLWGQAVTPGNGYWIAGAPGSCPALTDSGAAALSANLCSPAGVAVDSSGTILVASTELSRIYGIGNVLSVTTTSLPQGTVGTSYSAPQLAAVGGVDPLGWTVASGSLPPGITLGSDGNFSGTPTTAGIYPFTVGVTDSGNPPHSTTADLSITVEPPSATATIETSAGDGSGNPPQGAPATSSGAGYPVGGLVVDAHGNTVFATLVVDSNTFEIYGEVDVLAGGTGKFYGMQMMAGNSYVIAGGGSNAAPGVGTDISLISPSGLTVDHAGNLVVADSGYNQVFVIADSNGPDFGMSMTAGDLYPVAGTGTSGYAGDTGAATSAELSSPQGLATDSSGNIVVADGGNNAIRVIAASNGPDFGVSMIAGNIYTIAGTGNPTGGYAGDGGAATLATLNDPAAVAVDPSGNVAVADYSNNVIRLIAHPDETMHTIAGNGTPGFNADGIAATSSELSGPAGVAYDDLGNLYIADSSNNRVRMIPQSAGNFYGVPLTAGDIYTVAGTGTGDYSGDGGPSGMADLYSPEAVDVSPGGTLLIADFVNGRIRAVAGGLPASSGPLGLSFSGEPSSTTAGQVISPPVAVSVVDAFNNPVAGQSVTVSPSGFGFASGTLTEVTNASGVATFGDLVVDQAGSGYTITAADGAASATSTAFAVAAAGSGPLALSISGEPSNTTAGQVISPAVGVTVVDAFNNPVAGSSVTVSPAGAAYLFASGTLTEVTNASGVATFGDLVVDHAGSGYTITAADGAASATSTAFSVTAAASGPLSVSFSGEPSNSVAGQVISPAVGVTVVDAFNNPVAGQSVTVSPSGFAFASGTFIEVTNGSGVATFPDLVVDHAGTGYKITAADGAASATSTAFSVTAAASGPLGLSFSGQPSSTTAGQVISPAVGVTVVDAFNNPVAGQSVTVSPSGFGFASGTFIEVTNASGVATFGDLVVDQAGSGYTITAADGAASATSTAFSVTAAASGPLGLSFSGQPSSTTAGQVISPAVAVRVVDAFNNPVAGSSVTVSPSGFGFASGTLTEVTNASGVATFPDLVVTQAGSGYKITATDGAASATSTAFSVNALAPVVSAVSPSSGAVTGGTQVTITGTGFSTVSGGTVVRFGSSLATNVKCTSTTQCSATSPQGLGTVDVTVVVGGQQSTTTSADKFTYLISACGTLKITSSYTVHSGQILCLGPGSVVSGTIAVQPGGGLVASGAKITGNITAQGPVAFQVCQSTISNTVSVTGATGLIVIGGPSGGSCAGNTISGTVTLTSNQDGVELDNNYITGTVKISGTTGSLPAPYSGSVQVVGNSGSGKLSVS
ncbi:MAG TPA: IPT/TIG domain-containing protein [Acidimicrobiales bacterium]|nr:IPT/TIG domain-containing protein [Acidimicrobiales bacterium]